MLTFLFSCFLFIPLTIPRDFVPPPQLFALPLSPFSIEQNPKRSSSSLCILLPYYLKQIQNGTIFPPNPEIKNYFDLGNRGDGNLASILPKNDDSPRKPGELSAEHLKKDCALILNTSDETLISANEAPPFPSPSTSDMGKETLQEQAYFTFSAEAIYWQIIQDNLLTSIKAGETNTGPLTNLIWINQQFNFDPGLRVGIGGIFPYDKWHLIVSYTFLRTSSSQFSENSNPEFYMILSGHMQSLAKQVKTAWEMHFQSLELMLGREFFMSNYLAIKPQMGIKGAYPNQTWHVSYIHPTFAQNEQIFLNQRIENSFWSIGPNLGMDLSWKLPKKWEIQIHPSWSVMYAKIYSKVIYSDIANAAEGVNPDTEIHGMQNVAALIPQIEIWLGAKWSYPFHNNRLFQITVGYDVQYWWNEANILAFIQLPQGNLMLHGATCGLSLSF